MKRSVIETVLGAVVLVLAGFFLVFSYKTANISRVSGYDIIAEFSGTGGLATGDDVRISGVKVGSVNHLQLDSKNYLAVVTMSIDPAVKLPDDTAAIISSDSLLGGRYLELQPGASDTMMKQGDHIQYTQAPQNLEQLLGKFIFSMGSKAKSDDGAQAQASNSGADLSQQASQTGMPLLSAATSAKSKPESASAPKAESTTKSGTDKSGAGDSGSDDSAAPAAATTDDLKPEDKAVPAAPNSDAGTAQSQPAFQSSSPGQAHP